MANIFPTSTLNSRLKIHEDDLDKFWFYHKPSFPNDYPEIYRSILSKAVSNIEIWDPYFNTGQNDQEVFTLINSNISIKILTLKALNGSGSYFHAVANDLKLVIPRSKNIRFAMRAIDKSDTTQFDWRFHDRFLILDQSDVYLIGCSLAGHTVPHLSTGIYKVTETDTKTFIISIFREYWRTATNQEYTLRFLHT